jgi:hypothetical protein
VAVDIFIAPDSGSPLEDHNNKNKCLLRIVRSGDNASEEICNLVQKAFTYGVARNSIVGWGICNEPFVIGLPDLVVWYASIKLRAVCLMNVVTVDEETEGAVCGSGHIAVRV